MSAPILEAHTITGAKFLWPLDQTVHLQEIHRTEAYVIWRDPTGRRFFNDYYERKKYGAGATMIGWTSGPYLDPVQIHRKKGQVQVER